MAPGDALPPLARQSLVGSGSTVRQSFAGAAATTTALTSPPPTFASGSAAYAAAAASVGGLGNAFGTRSAGGRATVLAKRQPVHMHGSRAKETAHATLRTKQQQSKRLADAAGRLPLEVRPDDLVSPSGQLSDADMRLGVGSLLERGLLPPGFDPGEALAGPPGAQAVSASAAPLHRHMEQFRRRDILTTDMSGPDMAHIKLDLQAVATLPPEIPPGPKPPMQSTNARRQLRVKAVATAPPQPPPEASPVLSDDPASKGREDPRSYAELLDMYSLHEFIIRKGKALRSTPEFSSYQRSFAGQWGAILHALAALERLLAEHGVPLAYVDGKKLAAVAAVDLGPPAQEVLLACLNNRDDVAPLIANRWHKFARGAGGTAAAATVIQSMVRAWVQRRAYKRLRVAAEAARRIQRRWALHRGHMRTRDMVKVVQEALLQRWRHTQANFAERWPVLRRERRLAIHLPSLALPAQQSAALPAFQQLQRAHLPRLTELLDDNVDVVLLSPQKYEPEVLAYYYSMLASAGVRNPEGRLMVLVPETLDRLPENLSLTKSVLCSQRLLKVLGALVKGKVSYIVPGLVGAEEQVLAAKLNVPMLGPDAAAAAAFGAKSGTKEVFHAAEVATPVGAHRVRDEAELFATLSRLVAEFPEFPRWVVKLDDEHGGRGTAFLDVKRLKAFDDPAAKAAALAGSHSAGPLLAEAVQRELFEVGQKRMRVVSPHCYVDWLAFAAAIPRSGGCVVEAVPAEVLGSPVVNVLVEPDGTATVRSVQQQVFSPAFVATGVAYPSGATAADALHDAALAVAAAAFRKKLIGHLSIDFVVHRKQSGAVRLWATGLKLQLTIGAALHEFVAACAGAAPPDAGAGGRMTTAGATTGGTSAGPGGLSVASGTRSTLGGGEPGAGGLHYQYSGLMYHPYLGALRHGAFFGLCKQRGYSFDAVSRRGVLFHMVDTLLCNCLGAVAVGGSPGQCASQLMAVLDFIQQQLAAVHATADEGAANVHHIVAAARNVAQRTAERKERRRG